MCMHTGHGSLLCMPSNTQVRRNTQSLPKKTSGSFSIGMLKDLIIYQTGTHNKLFICSHCKASSSISQNFMALINSDRVQLKNRIHVVIHTNALSHTNCQICNQRKIPMPISNIHYVLVCHIVIVNICISSHIHWYVLNWIMQHVYYSLTEFHIII